MALAPGQLVNQPAVDGPERQVALLGARPRALHMVQNPGDLGGREIGIKQQPTAGIQPSIGVILTQFPAAVCGAPVLPDDGVVDGLPGLAIPDNRGLTLVGDAAAGQFRCLDAYALQHFATDFDGVAPDDLGIVFHPAALGVDLFEFGLGRPEYASGLIEDDRACAGRALVNGQ